MRRPKKKKKEEAKSKKYLSEVQTHTPIEHVSIEELRKIVSDK